MEDDRKKKIDDEWKKAIEKEKSGKKTESRPAPEVNFEIFLTGLMFDCLVAMGELDNPITQKKEENLNHAKYVIDIIALIKEKTAGNLTKQEAALIENMIYQLQMKYVAKVK